MPPDSVTEASAKPTARTRITNGSAFLPTVDGRSIWARLARDNAASKPKSELYQGLLPLLNSGRIRLLDSERLKQQLLNLERRTSRSGRDSIDHPPHMHDDVANAVAGGGRKQQHSRSSHYS